MKNKTRQLTVNAILLAVGLLLHQITPAIGLPIQPDMSLIMLFTLMIMNKKEYKTIFICALVIGIFSALTTKFPGGQIPNIIDKVVTANIVFVLMYIIYNIPFINKLDEKKQDFIVSVFILPIGTLISGSVFLLSASILVGLPGSFYALFLVAVAPAILINLVVGVFVNKIVNISVKRMAHNVN